MMRKVIGWRASSVLYSWLKCNDIVGKVLMPANICESVPATYMKAGCEIVFCDVSPYSWEMSEREIISQVETGDINILHYNHTYGYKTDCEREFLKRLKETYPKLIIVEDCCLCEPESMVPPECENIDAILYSTGNVKVVNIHEGGYAMLNNRWNYVTATEEYCVDDETKFDIYIKECHNKLQKADIDMLTSNWIRFKYEEDMDEYFKKIEKQRIRVSEHKRIINDIYKDIPGAMAQEYNNWRFNILIENVEECTRVLYENGLFCSSHYMSLGNGYFDDIKTPNCDFLHKHVLNLFNDFAYNVDQATRTAEILREIARPLRLNI